MDNHTLIQALIYLGSAALIVHCRATGARVSAGVSHRRVHYWTMGPEDGDRR